MTGKKTHQVNFLLSEKDKSVNRELDEARSGAWATACTVAATSAPVYNVPTSRAFELRTLIINSDATGAPPNTIYFYDGTAATTPVFKTTVGKQETIFVTDIKNVSFTDYVFCIAGVASTAQVTVGGVLRDQHPDGT